MTGPEIDRIVLLTPAAYSAELARLEAAEADAYSAYCGGARVPAAAPGTPRAAGLGSWVCDLNAGGVQDAWVSARRAAEEFRAVVPVDLTAGTTKTNPEEFAPTDYGEVLLVENGLLLFRCPAGPGAGYKPCVWGQWHDEGATLDDAVRLAVEALGARAVEVERKDT